MEPFGHTIARIMTLLSSRSHRTELATAAQKPRLVKTKHQHQSGVPQIRSSWAGGETLAGTSSHWPQRTSTRSYRGGSRGC